MYRTSFFLLLMVAVLGSMPGQVFSLEASLEAARAAHPLQEQLPLIERIGQVEDENLGKQWLPNWSVNAQGTYQSEVIAFPENSPLGNLPTLPQAQYRATLELQQPLYEGGAIKQSRLVNGYRQKIEGQQVEVNLAELERRVTELYFAALEADAQRRSVETSLEYLKERRGALVAAVRNGVTLGTELLRYDQEILRLEQQIAQISGQERALKAALAVQVGKEEGAALELRLPPAPEAPASVRPELQLFSLQQGQLGEQQRLVAAGNRPKIAAFATGGLGQPNPFNFLNVDLSGYYLLGIRLTWTPYDWGMTQGKQEILQLQQQKISQQKRLFERQQQTELVRLDQQILSLESLAAQDEQLMDMQSEILKRAESQLEHGTLTTLEYLQEVQRLTRYRLSQELHEVQLRKLQVQRQQVQ